METKLCKEDEINFRIRLIELSLSVCDNIEEDSIIGTYKKLCKEVGLEVVE